MLLGSKDSNVADIQDVLGVHQGKWIGSRSWFHQRSEAALEAKTGEMDTPSEKLLVPEFAGEGSNERDLGQPRAGASAVGSGSCSSVSFLGCGLSCLRWSCGKGLTC